MFAYGTKKDEFTDEDAKREFERIEEELVEQMHAFDLPDALLAENMMQLLDGVTPGVTQPARVINYKKEYSRFIAYAACFVLVIAGFSRFVKSQNDVLLAAEADFSGAFDTGAGESTGNYGAYADSFAIPEEANETDEDATVTTDAENAVVARSFSLRGDDIFVTVDGVYYRYVELSSERVEAEADGSDPAVKSASEEFNVDDDSEFAGGCTARICGDDMIEVLVDGEWYLFEKAEQ